MKGLRIEGPTKLADGCYEVRVRERRRGGRERRRRFDTKKLAFHFLDNLSEEQFNRRALPDKAPKLSEVYELWREANEHEHSPGWKRHLDRYWNQVSDYHSFSVDLITPKILEELQRQWRAKGNAQKTINSKLGLFRSLAKFAVMEKMVFENPLGTFKYIKPKKGDVNFLEFEDAMSFLEFAGEMYPLGSPKRWVYSVYHLVLNAGLRAGEVWALKPRCLRPSMGLIMVSEQFDHEVKDFRPPKSGKSRNVPMNDAVYSELSRHIAERGLKRNDLFFPSKKGTPMDHDSFLKRQFYSDLKEWGGPKIRFHDLRHTAGTLMVAAGVDVRTVQEILGHEDIKTTLRYLHVVSANVRDAGAKLQLTPTVKPKLSVV